MISPAALSCLQKLLEQLQTERVDGGEYERDGGEYERDGGEYERFGEVLMVRVGLLTLEAVVEDVVQPMLSCVCVCCCSCLCVDVLFVSL